MNDFKFIFPYIDEKELPLIGKTYSLYNYGLASDEYYTEISNIADELLKLCNNPSGIIDLIDNMSQRKRPHLKFGINDNELISSILFYSRKLAKYTYPAKSHIDNLSFMKRFDKTISTTDGQYHLYMIEIELVNRLNLSGFKDADIKLAFLPHCLHDLNKDCLSKNDGVDYVCGKCSKDCFINAVTGLLNSFNIKTYIWRQANLKSLFKKLKLQNKRIGVLGIACLAELMNGMRMCMKLDVPVIGVPLDANRCRRWMGDFHTTSVNLQKLETILN